MGNKLDVNSLIGNEATLARRMKNLSIREQTIAANMFSSEVLQTILLARGDLIAGLSEEDARRISYEIPDYLLFERIATEFFMMKDGLAEMASVQRAIRRKYKNGVRLNMGGEV